MYLPLLLPSSIMLLAWVDLGPLGFTRFLLLFSLLPSVETPRALEFGQMITPPPMSTRRPVQSRPSTRTPTYTTEKGGRPSLFDGCPFGRIRGRTTVSCLLPDECCPWTNSKGSCVITPHDPTMQELSHHDRKRTRQDEAKCSRPVAFATTSRAETMALDPMGKTRSPLG
ncbi:hypothetical protein LZ30DRAFT_39762 [Colletotrichum cereale]|nr:hypothetical protein LZ30DRAFT_39762 [Colletotrichum cereale]